MQHYIHYGLGFNAKLLTDAQFKTIVEKTNAWYEEGDIHLCFIPFTETDYDEKSWGTVVIKDCGEIPNAGKMVSMKEMNALCSKEMVMSPETQKKIKEELRKYGLSKLFDKIEVIIFSDNY